LKIAVTTENKPGGKPRGKRRAAREPTDRIQLLIVDQHPVLRAGVRTLLENEERVEVVAEADSVAEAVDAARENPPDVVLLDVDESSAETVEDMRRLRREVPDGALVVLARHEDDDEVYRAVVGGAAGHVGDTADPDELADTIRAAADGEEPIQRTLVERPNVARRVLETFADLAGRRPARPARVSEREIRILDLAAQGMTNYQIGVVLGVSEHTVKSSISQLLSRLGLRHRTEAVVYALKNGWIGPAGIGGEGSTGSSSSYIPE
jgi:DNA-binding NarL/FixJ family response regulator